MIRANIQSSPERGRRGVRRAWTVIELLVVIGIVSVLLAITIPTLRGVRRQGDATQCLTHLRSCATAVTLYTKDFRDVFPYFGDPSAHPSFRNGGVGCSFFAQAFHWPLVVSPYLTSERVSPVQLCPQSPAAIAIYKEHDSTFLEQYPPNYVFTSDYSLSYTTFTRPEFWETDDVSWNQTSLMRSVSVHEAIFPSSKGVMLETTAFHARDGTPYGQAADMSIDSPGTARVRFHVAFCDGSTRALAKSSLASGIGKHRTPVMKTRHGIRGIDLGSSGSLK